MVSQALERPVLTREQIIDQFRAYAEQRVVILSRDLEKVGSLRGLEGIRLDLRRQKDDWITFSRWIVQERSCNSNPLQPGKFWLLTSSLGRLLWIICDLQDSTSGQEVMVRLNDQDLWSRLGVKEISTVSGSDPFYRRIKDMIIREGMNLTFAVDGNRPEIWRLDRVL